MNLETWTPRCLEWAIGVVGGWATSTTQGDCVPDSSPFQKAVATTMSTFPLISYPSLPEKLKKYRLDPRAPCLWVHPTQLPGLLEAWTDSEFAIVVWEMGTDW